MELHKEFKKLRKRKAYSLDVLSAVSGVQKHRIKKFEDGDANITLKTLNKMLEPIGGSINIS